MSRIGRLAGLVMVSLLGLVGGFGCSKCVVQDADISGQYEGGCKDGFADGQGTAKGKDIFVGEFIYGRKVKGTYTWHNGLVYVGQFVKDKKSGYGEAVFANGDVYKGNWANGLRNGHGELKTAKGNIYEGDWENNELVSNKFGLFVDMQSGLVWRRCALGRNWNETTHHCEGEATKSTWADSVSLVHGDNYAAYDDWRIPTAKEYKTFIQARSGKHCHEIESTIKKIFPDIRSRYMFGSNHWLADNSGDLMNPLSAALELTGGFGGCDLVESSLRAHAKQPVILVRGGSTPGEWTFALSKMHLAAKINAQSTEDGNKYWAGVNKKLNDIMTSSSNSASSGSSSIPCSTSEYCFEVIDTKWEDKNFKDLFIKCVKGPKAHPYSKECISYSKISGKWSDGCVMGTNKSDQKAAGNSACGVY